LRLFRRAEALGNVSAACRELGVSRSLYYALRKRFVRYGPDGLHPKRQRGRRGRPPAIDATTERQVLALSLAWPSFGPQQLSAQLARQGVIVARSTVHRVLRRRGLSRRQQRFAALEGHSAERAGLLTERTRRQLAKVRPLPTDRHVEANHVGELV
jgi:transposase